MPIKLKSVVIDKTTYHFLAKKKKQCLRHRLGNKTVISWLFGGIDKTTAPRYSLMHQCTWLSGE